MVLLIFFAVSPWRNNTDVIVVGFEAGNSSSKPLMIKVYLDGSYIARGDSVISISLKPGKHRLRIESEGYLPYEKSVFASPDGGEAYVTATMQKKNP